MSVRNDVIILQSPTKLVAFYVGSKRTERCGCPLVYLWKHVIPAFHKLDILANGIPCNSRVSMTYIGHCSASRWHDTSDV